MPKLWVPKPQNVDAEIMQAWEQHETVTAGLCTERSEEEEALKLHQKDLKRRMRQLARQRKRDVLMGMLELISEAQTAGDAHSQYQFIRKVCPKSFRRKISMKTKEGLLMTAEEECEALTAHAKALFSGEAYDPPELLPLPPEWFSAEAWSYAVKHLSNHKAVPRNSASVSCWKNNIQHLATSLESIAHTTICSENPYIPEVWVRVQLAWLPKPGKAPTAPAQLRSIGLMSPDTKAFLSIIKSHANPWIQVHSELHLSTRTDRWPLHWIPLCVPLCIALKLGKHSQGMLRTIQPKSCSRQIENYWEA